MLFTSILFPSYKNFVYIPNTLIFNFLFTTIFDFKFAHEFFPIFCGSVSLLKWLDTIISLLESHTESSDKAMNASQLRSGSSCISSRIVFLKWVSLKDGMVAIYWKCFEQAEFFFSPSICCLSAFFNGS